MTRPLSSCCVLISLLISIIACSAENSSIHSTQSTGQSSAGTSGTSGIDNGQNSGGYEPQMGGLQEGVSGNSDLPISGMESGICASTDVRVSRTIVNFILVVDRSSTMTFPFGSYPSRWDALREALLGDPNGLVPQYQQIIRFGYEGYTGFGTSLAPGNCPELISVPFELNNYDKILEAYNSYTPTTALPFAQTPTGESLEVVINNIEQVINSSGPDMDIDPFYILLATDGAPDTCINPDVDGDPPAMQKVIEQAKRANELGVDTYVLSVGDDTSDIHLQEVANAGTGVTGAPFWKANDDQGLRDALTTIIGAATSCTLILDGEIIDPKSACEEGEVILNSEQLPCDDQNGWRVLDSTRIEIVGQACTTMKSSPAANLSARFPCDIVIT